MDLGVTHREKETPSRNPIVYKQTGTFGGLAVYGALWSWRNQYHIKKQKCL